MTVRLCPRCELNYILDGSAFCVICRKEIRGEKTEDDTLEMCSECGENPVVPGTEYCAQCLKEICRGGIETANTDDQILPEDAAHVIDSDVSSMDEIAISDPDAEAFGDDDDDAFDDTEEDEKDPTKRKSGKKKMDTNEEFSQNGYGFLDETGKEIGGSSSDASFLDS